MKSMLICPSVLLTGLLLVGAGSASAQGFDTQAPVAGGTSEPYVAPQPYTPPVVPNYDQKPLTYQQRAAQARAQQRQLRLATMAWYGMSNSRPTASPTPFDSLYSPVWQAPGGRPFAWYPLQRPTYLIYR
jgi:hypothetical protein